LPRIPYSEKTMTSPSTLPKTPTIPQPAIRFGLAALGLATCLVGCQQPKPIELAKPDGPAAPGEEAAGTPATPRGRRTFSERAPTPTPGPTSAADTNINHELDPDKPDTATHLVLRPTDFVPEAGKKDDEGGWILNSNSVLHIDRRRIPFEIHRIDIEVKGVSTGGIWPEFYLALYHHDTQRNLMPMSARSNFATTPDWQIQSFEQQQPLPAGHYRFDFRMLNAHQDPETGQNRTLHVRRIIFRGAKSLQTDLSNQ
jgi:hypothetical protein